MMKVTKFVLLAAVVALCLGPSDLCAQAWYESTGGGDAASTMAEAHDLTTTSYTHVFGTLHTSGDVDMYKIWIDDPAGFTATTVKTAYEFPGDVGDSWLYLFDADGRAVYSNDESALGDPANTTIGRNSFLPRQGDIDINPEGHGPRAPGVYYLAVTSFHERAMAYDSTVSPPALVPMFEDPFDPPRHPSNRTNGPMGDYILAEWNGRSGSIGAYAVSFTGEPVQVGVPKPASDLPDRFSVSDVYPNPFSSRAHLDISVPSAQRVRVDVYNVLGEHVATAFDGMILAQQTRAIAIDAGMLPTGHYLVAVRGDNFLTSKLVATMR